MSRRGCAMKRRNRSIAKSGDRLWEANCLRFQVLLEVKEENFPLAVGKFTRAIGIATAIGDRFTQAFIGLEMAEPLLALKHFRLKKA